MGGSLPVSNEVNAKLGGARMNEGVGVQGVRLSGTNRGQDGAAPMAHVFVALLYRFGAFVVSILRSGEIGEGVG